MSEAAVLGTMKDQHRRSKLSNPTKSLEFASVDEINQKLLGFPVKSYRPMNWISIHAQPCTRLTWKGKCLGSTANDLLWAPFCKLGIVLRTGEFTRSKFSILAPQRCTILVSPSLERHI
jgi:hypothetical protein